MVPPRTMAEMPTDEDRIQILGDGFERNTKLTEAELIGIKGR